jgi:hypothetical protein
MLYQRKHLADGADVGAPGPLPGELVGLADASLADLSWTDAVLGYQGDGFVPHVAASAPAAARAVTLRDFMRRFTTPELVAIETACAADAHLRVLRQLLEAGPTVDLDHADTAGALAYLTAQGLIAAGRAEEITA